MKNLLMTLGLLSMFLAPAIAAPEKDPNAAPGDAILGTWFNEEKDAKIDVYKQNGKYFGKVIWMKNPLDANGKPKTDVENPDPNLRSRRRLGLVILTDLAHKAGAKYAQGKVYDPKSGKTYSAQAELAGNNKLKLRGYIAVSLIGRTSEWTRAQ